MAQPPYEGPFPGDIREPNVPPNFYVPNNEDEPEPYQLTNPSSGGGTQELKPMSDEALLSIVQREIDSGLGWTGTRLAEARRLTLSDYFANPRGDEVEGRSQVSTRTVFEEVEWATPLLLEPFVSSPDVAVFIPEGSADPQEAEQREEEAKQRSGAANYVFSQKHEADAILETFAKDGLIQKNGFVKVFYEHSKEATHERYDGLTIDQVGMLDADPDYEIRGIGPHGEIENAQFFDVEGVRINSTGRTCVENIPPEEMVVNRDARSIREDDPSLRFIGHRIRTTESQMIAWGYDRDLVENVPSSQSVYTTDQDAIIRSSQDDSFPLVWSNRDDSERTIYVTECYVKLDKDGDGISEWHKVMVGGEYGQILLPSPETGDSTEPCEGHPFASWTPIGIPHRLHGYSLADITRDLQEIDTTLWRLGLDNAYLSINQRWQVLSQGTSDADAVPQVNLNQLINNAPGTYVEVYQQGALESMQQPLVLPHIIEWLGMHKEMRKHRTGISPEAMGLDPDAISKHVFGAISQQSAAQLRSRWYARRFGAGVKRIFQLIDRCLLMNHTQPMTFRLQGEWHSVDPSAWKTKMDCEITVGLGTGGRMEKAMHLQGLLEMQKQAVEAGARFVTEDDIYNAFSEYIASIGFKNTEKFLTDPATLPEEEPQEDPALVAVEYQQINETRKLEIENTKVMQQHEEGMRKLMIEEKQLAVQAAKVASEGGDPSGLIAMVENSARRELEMQDMVQRVAESAAEVARRVDALHQARSAPRRLLRDEEGNLIGVEMNGQQMSVNRDESGHIIGLQ